MTIRAFLPLALGASLVAQTPAAAPAPAAPSIKWRGSLWASAITQDRQTLDGSLAFRPFDAGENAFTLDGLMLGADVDLGKGFAVKATILAGHDAKIINAANGETGSFALPEAMLVWTGEKDTLRFGRMITFIGMEFLDGAANLTASRGLLFNFSDPFGQVGLNWHHAFTPSWSSDVWVFNGEDRTKDNNRSKTWGVGLGYNHGGASDKYVSVHAYRGPEQDGLGAAANTGAEGRQRERLCMMGQWVWGPSTLQWELSMGQEKFTASAIQGATAPHTAKWAGLGAIYRYAFSERTAVFFRAEQLNDKDGVRLGGDTTLAVHGYKKDVDLKAVNLSVGVEKKYGPAFARLELRRDSLNKDLPGLDPKTFKDGSSATLSVGASF